MKKFRSFIEHLYEDIGYGAPEIYSNEDKERIMAGKQLVPVLKDVITKTKGQFPFKFDYGGKTHTLSKEGHALLRYANVQLQQLSRHIKERGIKEVSKNKRISNYSIKDDNDSNELGYIVGEMKSWHPGIVEQEVVPFLKKYAIPEHEHYKFDSDRNDTYNQILAADSHETIRRARNQYSPIIQDEETGKQGLYVHPLELPEKTDRHSN